MKKYKRRIFGLLIVVILLTTPLLAGQKNYNKKISKNSTVECNDFVPNKNIGRYKLCFLIGNPDSVQQDEDKILITSGFEEMHIFYITSNQLYEDFCVHGTQIHIAKLYLGRVDENFIFAFCRLYIPDSTLSMHPIDIDDDENIVSFQVDDIHGDPIWYPNLDIDVYRNGTADTWGWHWQYSSEYVKNGDVIDIHMNKDGTYKYIFKDEVTNVIFYESDFLKV